ncbi:MAG: FAD-dependent thymidylate synthase [Proteobacteria bacterium]|nr:FAD-dependent thymidylate synthase [Pseudomonadota bacterium]
MSKTEVTFPDGAIRVLDKGFVKLVDVMGDDSAIVQAARVSYGKGTKSLNEDEGLIRYLMRHQHTTPLEMVEFKFHCRMPIFVARQWIRHRTANVNEMSARYSEMPDWFYEPDAELCTTQSAQNKQGGTGLKVEGAEEIAQTFVRTQEETYSQYEVYIGKEMRRELARINLPVSLYTEWYWKIDLHNLLHFLKLRLDSHAQYEIRVFAEAMAEIVKEKVPLAWKAFEDYSLNAIKLTGLEIEAMKKIISGQAFNIEECIKNKRERAEFIEKLQSFGYQIAPKA